MSLSCRIYEKNKGGRCLWQELHDIATKNMEASVTPQFQDMESMLRETMLQGLPPEMPQDMKDQIVEGVMAGQGAPSMYVLTNEDKLNGAAMILNPEAMEMVREAVGDDFFILPSSIHECLMCPRRTMYRWKHWKIW